MNQTIYDAIMGTDNTSGYTSTELNAGWGSPEVRRAAFEFANDTDSVEMLYQHFTYGEDGLPAVGYQSIAEQIAGEAAYRLDGIDIEAICESIGIDTTDHEIAGFIREPHDNGPGFGNDLSTIIEWSESTRQAIEKALPAQWEEGDDHDDEYNAARDLMDELESMEQFIRDEVESIANS